MTDLLVTSLLLGLTLGIAHALDPDHLIAVGTIAAESDSMKQSSLLGVMWGLGHTMALACVGGLLLSLKWVIPVQFLKGMEVLVGLMIIVLGVGLLRRSLRSLTIHTHEHRHDNKPHVHLHLHGQDTISHHHHLFGSRWKAFVVGLVHGVAGSAALSLAVMATMPSTLLGMSYLVVFGVGSIGGMLAMSTVMSVPFLFLASWWNAWHHRITVGTGLVAVGFGGYFIWSLLS